MQEDLASSNVSTRIQETVETSSTSRQNVVETTHLIDVEEEIQPESEWEVKKIKELQPLQATETIDMQDQPASGEDNEQAVLVPKKDEQSPIISHEQVIEEESDVDARKDEITTTEPEIDELTVTGSDVVRITKFNGMPVGLGQAVSRAGGRGRPA